MDTLGIDVGASVIDNMRTFKRMTNETGAFQYDEVVVWFQALSKKSECPGLSTCAEDLRRTTHKNSSRTRRKIRGGCGSMNPRNTGAS